VNNFLKKPLDFLVEMKYSINKMKNMKNTKLGRQQRRIASLKADVERMEKHTWHLELVIAACLGASLALAFVIGHQMLTTNWTW
jgi:predicted Co/Zn/Cd cation transporter (cation efflux family)